MIKTFYANKIDINSLIMDEDIDNTKVNIIVDDIIKNVRENGDKALYDYALKLDGAKLEKLKVTDDEINEAFNQTDPYFIRTLEMASENIDLFHCAQKPVDFDLKPVDGVRLGQKYMPVESVGLYIPGGTACYPSTVLMNAIPAKVAGVKNIIITTPPRRDGSVANEILVAAKIAGVTEIYKVGGAGAIAALAYGTESVPSVDVIVGPGNIYVATAKRKVYGKVGIDMIAGPSEILIIADETANADYVACDLLSQAEHDTLASSILVTTSERLAIDVATALEVQIPQLSRHEIARKSIDNRGRIIICNDIKECIKISNKLAPEHLEICLDNPFDYLDDITNAGSIFLGKNVPEALGDYFAGTNHIQPTNGTARFSSPLSVDDFIKKTQYIYYSDEALAKVSERVADFANREGLTAHAKSVTIRNVKK